MSKYIMKNIKIRKKVFLLFVLGMVFNQSFAQYEIRKYTINNGGSKMMGGAYKVTSSIGQVDASTAQVTGNYNLNGGFWHGNDNLIFKNGFE